MELLVLVAVALASILADAWFFYARCSASPDIYISGVVLAVVMQGGSMYMLWFLRGLISESQQIFRHRGAVLGLSILLCIGSLLIMEESLLFSDARGQPKGFKSQGQACPRAPWRFGS
jgi:hypothetical protein